MPGGGGAYTSGVVLETGGEKGGEERGEGRGQAETA
jgi:hypothetical protein